MGRPEAECGLLRVTLTGEPVTIVGGSRFCLELAAPVGLSELFDRLGSEVHPWFGALYRSGGRLADLGEVMVVLDGRRLDLMDDADLAVSGGHLYIIPPITGG